MLIPTQLVIDTCYATFVKLEGDKLGEEETKATWEGRLAMVASNRNADEGEQEAFVVSKYDLLPENLADIVQVSCVHPPPPHHPKSREIARVSTSREKTRESTEGFLSIAFCAIGP